MNNTIYYAPTYFSPYFFAPLGPSSSGGPGEPTNQFRDRDVFASIIGILNYTSEFFAVILGEPDELGKLGASQSPLIIITPFQWEERDDVDPVTLFRRVQYHLTLVVRDEEPENRYDLLDRLSSVVQNALDGSSLNGGCLPALSKIREGRFDKTSCYPEQRLAMQGEFTYLVANFQNHCVI